MLAVTGCSSNTAKRRSINSDRTYDTGYRYWQNDYLGGRYRNNRNNRYRSGTTAVRAASARTDTAIPSKNIQRNTAQAGARAADNVYYGSMFNLTGRTDTSDVIGRDNIRRDHYKRNNTARRGNIVSGKDLTGRRRYFRNGNNNYRENTGFKEFGSVTGYYARNSRVAQRSNFFRDRQNIRRYPANNYRENTGYRSFGRTTGRNKLGLGRGNYSGDSLGRIPNSGRTNYLAG
jgi:hypothetical protein